MAVRVPEAVRADVEAFVAAKRKALGATPMAYIAIKVAPARFYFLHMIADTNRVIEDALAGQSNVRYLDVTRRMIGRGIERLRACSSADSLNISPDGYRVRADIIEEYLGGTREPNEPIRIRRYTTPTAWRTPNETPKLHTDPSVV